MATLEELSRRVELLEHQLQTVIEDRLGRQEDVQAIERLQYSYGYYLDGLLYDAITELFAEDAAIEIGQRGRYQGKANIRRFLYEVLGTGVAGLSREQIINHTQYQGLVSIGDDRQSARARFRALIQASAPAPRDGESQQQQTAALMWSDGVYENRYVRENGQWKFALLWWSPTFYVTHPYERLWFDSVQPSTVFPPQRASYAANADLGRVFMPYHYRHPVTGEAVLEQVVK